MISVLKFCDDMEVKIQYDYMVDPEFVRTFSNPEDNFRL